MHLLIVDDEKPARDKLRRLLAQIPAITAIDEAADGVEALERIAALNPDAVFLDIQMPEVSGLDVAASLPSPAPLLVFATAYDEYAIRAFDANAVDYLLKPYDEERLRRAVERLQARLASRTPAPPTGLPARQLLVNERGATRIVRSEDILWLETADNYVVLHTMQGSPMLRQTLSALLDTLGPDFIRVHRRAAVRRGAVERVEADAKGDGTVQLCGGAGARLSRQFRAALMAALSG
ncbi:LytR/AlgR family response regulator transcription factor [Massilia sp. SM-13]|uniref:LytR/AlgR family response regulator transcription factor n=1 Tax=Pseudoduganella rhizocola TaxID=3382643 RepID=UPI0038B5BDB6